LFLYSYANPGLHADLVFAPKAVWEALGQVAIAKDVYFKQRTNQPTKASSKTNRCIQVPSQRIHEKEICEGRAEGSLDLPCSCSGSVCCRPNAVPSTGLGPCSECTLFFSLQLCFLSAGAT
jgi:hypothetical protein